ncbi:MAG: multicopper oxidase domain-containing protein, partial [Chloroflexota bacterium]
MYHPHTNAVAQIDNGLYGVLIVDPQQPDAPKPAQEFTMMLGAWNLPSSGAMAPAAPGPMPGGGGMPGMGGMMPGIGGTPGMGGGGGVGMMMNYNWFTINGKAFPATGEWVVRENDIVRVRLINVSNLAHPMHLHGQDFKVIAKDGEPLAAGLQTVMNTLTLNPGGTYDVLFLANNPGVWVFHCHELHHVENDGVEPG